MQQLMCFSGEFTINTCFTITNSKEMEQVICILGIYIEVILSLLRCWLYDRYICIIVDVDMR